MKRKSLLLIGAFVSVFTSAFAWEKPAAPASQPLAQDGVTEQYLYNVGAEGFLLGANNWYTRASVDPTYGYKWKVEEYGANYLLIDFVERDNDGKPADPEKWGWRRMFADDASNIWVDNNTGANSDLWAIQMLEGNKFCIGNDAIDGLLGVRAAETNDTRCYFTSAYEDEVLSTEWYSVSVEEYGRYVTAVETYEAAMELKAALDEAKAQNPGLDLSAWEAVYNNENSTAEELKAAAEAVKEALRNAEGANATWTSPVDMTSSIDNPSFETGSMGNWTTAGSGGDTGVKPNNNDTYTAEPCDGEYLFNTWGRNPLIVEQVLPKMPKGIYKLTALYASDKGNVGRLFANSDTLDINAGADKKEFVEGTLVAATVDGELKIGMTSKAWFKADNFRLMFHGNDAEGSKAYVEANVPHFDEEDLISVSLLDALQAAIDNALAGVSNVEEAVAAIAEIKEFLPAIEENQAAWARYQKVLERAKVTIQDEHIDMTASAVLALSDYLEFESVEIILNKELTTDQLDAEIEKVEEMINAALACLGSGSDFTHMLVNPEMDSAEGWSGNPTINANCGEKYGSGEFDVYQVVDGDVPVGIYEITMQGFYRQYRDDDANKTAWYNIFEDTPDARTFKAERNVLSYVYMNSNKTPMNCVYDYAVEGTYDAETNTYVSNLYESGFSVDPYNLYSYPNTMANAAAAFAQGAYKVSAYGLVAKDGDKLRVGVKGNLGSTGNGWSIFDNFRLIFHAKDEALINQLLPDAKAGLDLTGKKVGKDVRELVAQTIQDAENAPDAEKKFDALALCFDLTETIEASVKLFQQLEVAIGELEGAMNNASDIGADPKVIEEAGILFEEAYNGWESETYTDADAQNAIKKIEELINLLKIPAFIGSDDNPVDMTALIKDANFDGLSISGDKYGAWTWKKKEGNGPNYTNAFEFWAGNAANLEFSLTQDIVGLPAAKYELKAKAANSYNGQSSIGESGRAYLFAKVSGKTAVPSVAVEPQTEDATYYSDYSVIFTVEEGAVVTVGFTTVGTMDARWFSGDDFELWCYGAESIKTDTPDNMGPDASIESMAVAVAPVAIYNAAGVKTSTFRSGLNIVRLSNGKTIKVMVK